MMTTAEAVARLQRETVRANCLDHERITAWYREHQHNVGLRGGSPIHEYVRRALCARCHAWLEVTER